MKAKTKADIIITAGSLLGTLITPWALGAGVLWWSGRYGVHKGLKYWASRKKK